MDVLDQFEYEDPNVPCYVDNAGRQHFYKKVGRWVYVHVAKTGTPSENKITGWAPLPRRDGGRRTSADGGRGGALCALAENEGTPFPLGYWDGWH